MNLFIKGKLGESNKTTYYALVRWLYNFFLFNVCFSLISELPVMFNVFKVLLLAAK